MPSGMLRHPLFLHSSTTVSNEPANGPPQRRPWLPLNCAGPRVPQRDVKEHKYDRDLEREGRPRYRSRWRHRSCRGKGFRRSGRLGGSCWSGRRCPAERHWNKKGETKHGCTTQDVLTRHLACFGKGDLVGIMGGLHGRVETLHPERRPARAGCDPGALRDDVLGIREAGDVLRDVEAGHRWRHGLHPSASGRRGRPVPRPAPSPLAFAGLSLFSWSSAAPWSPAEGLLSWPTRFSRRPWSRRYLVLKFNRGRDIPTDGAKPLHPDANTTAGYGPAPCGWNVQHSGV
jgi:hypothetical protein